MPIFRYTVIDVTQRKQAQDDSIRETTGVVKATSMQDLVFFLTNRGYVVREIRPATPEDISLYRLKKFQRSLVTGKKHEADELPHALWVDEVGPRFRWLKTAVIVICVILALLVLIVASVLLET